MFAVFIANPAVAQAEILVWILVISSGLGALAGLLSSQHVRRLARAVCAAIAAAVVGLFAVAIMACGLCCEYFYDWLCWMAI